MSKELLCQTLSDIPGKGYSWSLYFFKIDRRSNNPYTMNKVRFKQQQYLVDYAHHLSSVVSALQVEKISQVQDYDGENTKISCDKLALNSDLISERWAHFELSVAYASDEIIKGKINGYILVGHAPSESDYPSLTMVKVANPIIKLNNKRSIAYKNTEDDELDLITDDIYRLYLTVDFIVFEQHLYTFNHNFEAIFDVEKTLLKVKLKASEKILETNCVYDAEAFRGFISQYKSPRTFITLNEKRIEKISQSKGRTHIASILRIPIDDAGLLVVSDMEKASLLIKYLCYKIFQESETEDVLEASTITKVQLA